ncbi:hypothetical protein B0H10DRAFT_1957653 [Mycena sp. CBHHK59/15]|nr:hypothetical protein B0H10DRAFT_1957653 [Mycena sp. CBHHK59/15]
MSKNKGEIGAIVANKLSCTQESKSIELRVTIYLRAWVVWVAFQCREILYHGPKSVSHKGLQYTANASYQSTIALVHASSMIHMWNVHNTHLVRIWSALNNKVNKGLLSAQRQALFPAAGEQSLPLSRQKAFVGFITGCRQDAYQFALYVINCVGEWLCWCPTPCPPTEAVSNQALHQHMILHHGASRHRRHVLSRARLRAKPESPPTGSSASPAPAASRPSPPIINPITAAGRDTPSSPPQPQPNTCQSSYIPGSQSNGARCSLRPQFSNTPSRSDELRVPNCAIVESQIQARGFNGFTQQML